MKGDDIFIAEVITLKDDRSRTPEIIAARKLEIDNLIRRETFKWYFVMTSK